MDRKKKIAQVRENLANGLVSLGSWIQIPNSDVAEIMGAAGYDWVAIDLEHGSIGVQQLPDMCRALELNETLPLVRIAQGNPKDTKDALDSGAGGIIVPMLESAEQAIRIRDACCWPPNGNRGVGFSRANLFGKYFDDYRDEASQPLLVGQVEHIKAVNNLVEILESRVLDAIFVGPYDLSASMGLTGKLDDQKLLDSLREIVNTCLDHGVAAGIHVVSPSESDLEDRIRDGYRFIAYSIDAVFLHTSSHCPSIVRSVI